MSNQNAKQDDNQFHALLGHSGTSGTAETRRIVVGPFGGITSESTNTITLIDGTTTTNVTYIGNATPGTDATASLWQIKRIDGTITDYTTILFADGDANYDNSWSSRGTLSYS